MFFSLNMEENVAKIGSEEKRGVTEWIMVVGGNNKQAYCKFSMSEMHDLVSHTRKINTSFRGFLCIVVVSL